MGDQGWAEFAFGRVEGSAELEYGQRIVFFRWTGFDEGDAIGGSGSAEFQDDGSLEIERSSARRRRRCCLTVHRKTISSTACQCSTTLWLRNTCNKFASMFSLDTALWLMLRSQSTNEAFDLAGS
jgi:hypothetical protein